MKTSTEVAFLGEVSRQSLGHASERLVAQLALDGDFGLLDRWLCDRHQRQEGLPPLETIWLVAKGDGGLLRAHCVVFCLLCCVLCAVCLLCSAES